jgi:hypothetical protein
MASGQGVQFARQQSRFSAARKVFAALTILSVCALLALLLLSRRSGTRPPGWVWPTGSADTEINALAVVSLIASITSLVGFVTTTYLGWREDKRESQDASLERVWK